MGGRLARPSALELPGYAFGACVVSLGMFGELVAVTFVAALLCGLIFAPALLRLAFPATAPGRGAALSDAPWA